MTDPTQAQINAILDIHPEHRCAFCGHLFGDHEWMGLQSTVHSLRASGTICGAVESIEEPNLAMFFVYEGNTQEFMKDIST